MQLKNYQINAVNGLIEKSKKLLEIGNKSLILKSPTGSGKTIILAEFIQRFIKDDASNNKFSFVWFAPRKLHIQESLESIDFQDNNQSALKTSNNPGFETIAECEYFRIRRLNLSANAKYKIKESFTECAILSPFKGKPFCGNQLLEIGSSYISPYSNSCEIESEEESSLLITDFFSH